jgi:hypothetical protein
MCVEGPRMQCASVSVFHPVLFILINGNNFQLAFRATDGFGWTHFSRR